MKLSALFAKYLYLHRQLRLPGIGVFSIDPAVTIPDISDKNFPAFMQEIRFSQTAVAAPEEEFINFIRTETGKIRPLAESDIDSFLSDAKILLNIGKPFHLEGIGVLQKNRDNVYEFTPGAPILERLEGRNEPEPETIRKKAVFTEDNSPANSGRKFLIAFSVVAGIVLVIWLGYGLYNRNTGNGRGLPSDTIAIAPKDRSKANVILDSVQKIIDSTIQDSTPRQIVSSPAANNGGTGSYKFVIERTDNKTRALKRFRQIKDNLTDIRMDATNDSSSFSLYFILPASAADTTRIKDSLRVWYGRKEVWIEK